MKSTLFHCIVMCAIGHSVICSGQSELVIMLLNKIFSLALTLAFHMKSERCLPVLNLITKGDKCVSQVLVWTTSSHGTGSMLNNKMGKSDYTSDRAKARARTRGLGTKIP